MPGLAGIVAPRGRLRAEASRRLLQRLGGPGDRLTAVTLGGASFAHAGLPVPVDQGGLARGAEVLVVATGVPALVKGDWIRECAVVVDIGITRTDDGLGGDVEIDKAFEWLEDLATIQDGQHYAPVKQSSMRVFSEEEKAVLNEESLGFMV